MFESAELGHTVTQKEFDKLAPKLRVGVIEVQQALRHADFPVLIVLAGVDGAGKSELMRLLNEWMDPRWIATHAYVSGRDKGNVHPEFWQYWRDLPPKGRIGIYLSAWYSAPLLDHVYNRIGSGALVRELGRIAAFEQTLADDGALVLKYWFHLGKQAQKRRLKTLEKDPLQHWRVTKRDWSNWERFDEFVETAETIIARTSVAHAPWQIVDGTDSRHRSLAVLTDLRERIQAQLKVRAKAPTKSSRKPRGARAPAVQAPTVLSALDMTKKLSRADYGKQVGRIRARLHELYLRAKDEGVATILVFEGADAAGKGGAIKRLTAALDPRDFAIFPFASPTDEERAHHYLWRFWRTVPEDGRIAIYDRSWYGRVLVERVEGFASEDEWRRAYTEINAFEAELAGHGVVLVKFWMHIDKDEQERRFRERDTVPFKRWKLTDEDWRNREKWDAYTAAVNEMVERTSTTAAPWVLVEANDKPYARLKVIRSLCEAWEKALD